MVKFEQVGKFYTLRSSLHSQTVDSYYTLHFVSNTLRMDVCMSVCVCGYVCMCTLNIHFQFCLFLRLPVPVFIRTPIEFASDEREMLT